MDEAQSPDNLAICSSHRNFVDQNSRSKQIVSGGATLTRRKTSRKECFEAAGLPGNNASCLRSESCLELRKFGRLRVLFLTFGRLGEGKDCSQEKTHKKEQLKERTVGQYIQTSVLYSASKLAHNKATLPSIIKLLIQQSCTYLEISRENSFRVFNQFFLPATERIILCIRNFRIQSSLLRLFKDSRKFGILGFNFSTEIKDIRCLRIQFRRFSFTFQVRWHRIAVWQLCKPRQEPKNSEGQLLRFQPDQKNSWFQIEP